MKKIQNSILAEGETTGHAHRLKDDVEVYEGENFREFKLDNVTTLTHEEHKEIEIPTGEFNSGICQEYDWFEKKAKEVED